MPRAGPRWPSAPFMVPHCSQEKTLRRQQAKEEARVCVCLSLLSLDPPPPFLLKADLTFPAITSTIERPLLLTVRQLKHVEGNVR